MSYEYPSYRSIERTGTTAHTHQAASLLAIVGHYGRPPTLFVRALPRPKASGIEFEDSGWHCQVLCCQAASTSAPSRDRLTSGKYRPATNQSTRALLLLTVPRQWPILHHPVLLNGLLQEVSDLNTHTHLGFCKLVTRDV